MKKIGIILLILLCITGCSSINEFKNKDDKIVKIDKKLVGKTFIRTFHIYHIIDNNQNDYVFVTIGGYQGEEVDTVRISRDLVSSLELNKNYEFTFKITDDNIHEGIHSIFERSEIVKIEETTKEGKDQINEEIGVNN